MPDLSVRWRLGQRTGGRLEVEYPGPLDHQLRAPASQGVQTGARRRPPPAAPPARPPPVEGTVTAMATVRPLAAAAAGLVVAVLVAAALAGCGSRAEPPAERLRPATVGPMTTGAPRPSTAGSVSQAPTTTAAPAPPYALVSGTLPLVDPSRPTVSHGQTVALSRALPTLWWAPARPGRWPLIVFAHGYQVGPSPYVTLLQAWASAGYVVVAPELPLTDADVAGTNLDENDINNQPADLRFVADTVTDPDDRLSARIDPTRVIVAGHSDGAETALAASTQAAPAGEPVWRAVLAMSVAALPGVARSANPPILVTQGTADETNPLAEGVAAWQAASSPKYLQLLDGAGHLPPLEAGSPWLPALERTTLAFFALALGPGSSAALLAAGNDPPMTTLQAG